MRKTPSVAPNVFGRVRRFAGGLVGLGVLAFGASRCADLTAPATVGSVVITFADTTDSRYPWTSATRQIEYPVGSELAPRFEVSISNLPQSRARYIYSTSTTRGVISIIENGNRIRVVKPGLDTLIATVVGAAVGGSTTSPTARLADTITIKAAAASNFVDKTTVNFTSLGDTTSIRAEMRGVDNVRVPDIDIEFRSLAPAVASVAEVSSGALADSGRAVITAHTNGTAVIEVIYAGVDTVPVTVTVQQAFARYFLSPPHTEFSSEGQTGTITAVAKDARDSTLRVGALPAPAFSFVSSEAGKVSVAASAGNPLVGVLTAVANGVTSTDNVTIRAQVSGATASNDVTAILRQVATSVVIQTADTIRINSIGATAPVAVRAFDALGKDWRKELPEWISRNNSIVEQPAPGLSGNIIARGTGTVYLVAKADQAFDSVVVIVSNDPNSAAVEPKPFEMTSINETKVLFGRVRNAANTELVDVNRTWVSRDPTRVQVLPPDSADANQVTLRAVAIGEAFVVMTTFNGVADSVRVRVTNQPDIINIVPDTITLTNIGAVNSTFAVDFRNALGATLPKSAVAWSTADANVAQVQVGTGNITAVGPGTTYILAVNPENAQRRDSVFVVVTNSPASMTLTPGTAQTITAFGNTIDFNATVFNGAGNPITNASVTWSVPVGGAFLTIDPVTGIATAVANGSATVRATSGTVQVDVPVTIAQAFSATQSTITPAAPSIVANGSSTTTITAQLKDANGNNLAFGGATVVLSTSAGTLGAVTDAGNGAYTATLTSSTTIGTATVSGTVNSVGISSANNAIVAFVAGAAARYVVTSNNSTPVAGTSVTIRAQLADQNNNPLSTAGNLVQFTSTNGGSFTPADGQATTDGTGVATITFNTNTAVSSHTITATTGSLSGISAAITSVAGGGQNYLVTPAITNPAAGSVVSISAQLRDANGNPVALPNQTVNWTKSDGNGSFSNGGTSTTNASGVATINLTTHTSANTSTTVTATTPGLGAGTSVAITTVAGSAAAITITTAPQGNPQSGIAFAPQPSLQLRDGQGNPVALANVTVSASLTSGSGTISGGSAQTDGTGLATFATLAISGSTGPKTITFAVSGVGTVNANVTLGSGTATQIALNAGNGQTATVNTAVGTAPSVIVRDANNNPVQGVTVTFAIASGGGSFVAPGGGSTVNTDASGIAALTSWTLGTTSGSSNNSLTATVAGLTGSPITFTASANAGAANNLLALSATTQSATIGTAVAPPSVRVRDQFNNPVANFAVTFTLTANGTSGGSISPATPASISSDANGVASLSTWTLGQSAGTNNNTVTATGVGPGITFNASGAAAAAQNMIATNPAATSQSATVNTTVGIAPSVTVRDAANNPVAGVAVTFAIGSGGGSFAAPGGINPVITDANGIAALTSWTLGTAAGTSNNTLTATVSGLTGSPVTFTASASAGAASAATTTITAAPTSVAADGSSTSTITVQAKDSFGNNLTSSGGAVTLTASPGGALAVTDNTNGTYTATLPASGTAGVVTINGTINAAGITDDATVTRTDATAPQITGPSGGAGAGSSATSIAENVTAVHTFTANEAVTWSLTGGSDQARFSIVPGTGALSFNVAPDFEAPIDSDANNTYVVVVTATDGSSNVSNQTVTVTITDAIEVAAFTIDPIADANVAENSAYTSVTPALSGATPIGTVTYSITGTDAGSFTVNPSTGVVSMIARNFESPADANADNVYELTLVATDSDGNTDSEDWTVTVTDVIEVVAFTIDAIPNTAVMEGAPYTSVTPALSGGTPIGAVTWSISGGADAAAFTINPSTGVVSMIARDFENPVDANTDNVYAVIISATDADGNTDAEDWTVTVTNIGIAINPIPDISINENAAYTSVTPVLTGDTPAGTVTYTLGGADAARFTINPTTGVVSMVPRNFEAPVDANADNVYEVTITATDSEAQQDSEVWTVTILNVAEVANFTIDAIANANQAENAAYTGPTPNLSGDAPVGTVTWSITGADAALFTVNPSTGVVSMVARNFEAPVDANADNVYEVTLHATDVEANTDSEDWTVTITDVVEVANFTIDAIANVNQAENSAYTSVTPNLSGDAPIGTVTYTLAGADAADFTVNPSTGVVQMVARSFETPEDANTDNVYEVTLVATDSDGNTDSEDWTVTITDVIEVANFTINAIADDNVAENSPFTSVTPSLAGDAPIGTVTYTLAGADAADFTVNPGTGVVSMVARNFEAPADANADNVYEVTLIATDSDGNTDSEDFTVTVTDVNEVANFTIDAIANVNQAENSAYTSVTPNLSGDAPIGTITYTLAGADAADFTVNPSTGVVQMVARSFETPEDANADNVYEVTLIATDSDGNTDSEDWTVTITDVVEVANFTIDAIADANVAENAVYTGPTPNLSGDAPIGTVTYTLAGADAGDFTVNPSTGVVSMVARNFENPQDANLDNVYEVTLIATDADGNTDSEDWTVTVTDENDSFVIDAIADDNVAENAVYTGPTPNLSGGTPFGTVTYTLAGADAAAFTVNPSTGVVSMVARNFEAPVDANTDNVYEVTLIATDQGGNTDSEDWTVTVTDAVEVANFTINAIADANVNENSAYTSVTPSLAGDAPIGTVTYSIAGADAADFTVNPSTGVVSMVARNFEAPVDANTDNVYEVTLIATDSDGNTDSEDWTVTVDDVVETANFTIDAINDDNVAENAVYTGPTPNLSGDAPIGTVTYTLGGADAADFTVNPSTGVVSMVARNFESPVDANTDNVYEVTLIATDSDGNTDSEDFTVTVTDEVEVATFTIDAIANDNVAENAVYTGPTPSLSGDAPIGAVTYTLAGADAADFTVNPSTGVVSMVARNFETPVDANTDNVYEITLVATDADGNTDSEDWTVTVTDELEAPDAPTIVTVLPTLSQGELSVAFTAPAFDGGSAITNYEYSTDNGATWKLRQDGGAANTPLLITTESGSVNVLANNTTYDVRIRAVNAQGSGAASNMIQGTTLP